MSTGLSMKEDEKIVNVVLDTNILISSLFWKGNPHKIVELAVNKKIQVYISPKILTELEKVLKRDFKAQQEFIEQQTALILEYAKIVRPINKITIIKTDPDDNKILECALTAQANYILTYDKKHLLILKNFQGILIITPEQFLKILEQQK